ncbi:hypothetical protein AGRA3207_002514 [Actinomadura graeca]|uniref:Secreted protein n=1 Tax=Actinomadura graeca TaxID=2750812 RepID=A0ABX8QUJ2_9ACTN|nr:hypothetical protein [Actinomadura graeca]QXJ21639.1 hypothetical protein AGRA3207_002514 [Actinomadura graeca]
MTIYPTVRPLSAALLAGTMIAVFGPASGTASAGTATVGTVSAGAAAVPASPSQRGECAFGVPPGYRSVTLLFTCGWCDLTGQAGVTNGDWREYRCVPKSVGLDLFYELWVR